MAGSISPSTPGAAMMSRVGRSGAETCGEGELVGQWAAQSGVVAGGEGVSAHVDEGEGIGTESFSCGGDLLGHAYGAG